MLAGTAILAILALFGSCWTLAMVRNPKKWLLWWLDTLNIVDMETSRERRRTQETKLVLISSTACLGLILLTTVCVYHVVVDLQEMRREKTQFERDQQATRRQIEIMRSKKEFDKLK